MESVQLLDYEIVLLLAKYGEKRVLSMLAERLGLSADELQRRLKRIKEATPRITTRKPIDPHRIVDSIISEKPEKAAHLRRLFSRFQSRTFLPELKDVKRFFERHGRDFGKVKSRAQVIKPLFMLLANLDTSELASLGEYIPEDNYSSLGIISDEIMRRHR